MDVGTSNTEYDSMPDIWLPAWTTPVSIIMAIASGITLCAAAMFSCLLGFASIFGLVLCLFSNFHFETLIFSLTTFYPLIGFFIYPSGPQRRFISIVIALLVVSVCVLSLAFGMDEIFGIGIISTILLHGAALSGIGFGNYSARIASPYRWRQIHMNNNQCPRCRYDIRNLPTPRCPECGDTFEAELLS